MILTIARSYLNTEKNVGLLSSYCVKLNRLNGKEIPHAPFSSFITINLLI